MANGERNGYLTLRGYARSRGLAPSSVAEAIKSCCISRRADGLIDPERADREWAANSSPRAWMSGAGCGVDPVLTRACASFRTGGSRA